MKVLIAGATGVLGRRLTRRLLSSGHEVVGLVRNENSKDLLRELGANGAVADIFDPDSIARTVTNADVVIHAATSIPTKVASRPSDWAMNDRLRREGTRSLTKAAHLMGARSYVQQSVVWVGRPPSDEYFDEATEIKKPDVLFASAYEGEKISLAAGEKYGFKTTVLRCGGFYAADSNHTRLMAEGLLRRRLPLIGDGSAVSANIHADDAAEAFAVAAEHAKHGVWHVVDDDQISIREMLFKLADGIGAKRPFRIPLWLAKAFVWNGVIEFFTRSTRTSNARYKRDFNWKPKYPSYADGLVEVIGKLGSNNASETGGS